jgi:hypothetical protein
MNISKTLAPKSDQLNADDLIGGATTIKIRDVKLLDSDVQPFQIFFDGDNNKPYKPSKGMRRVIAQLWGADALQYIGRSLTLFRDDNVKFGGEEVGGIRISHASHITKVTRVLETVSKGKRIPITIEVLTVAKPKITDIEKAQKAIAEGKYTFEQIDELYQLTDEQVTLLKTK